MTEINKYHNSKIYKLVSPQTEKYYIGSTITTIEVRFSKHKYDYKRYIEKGIGRYITSFEIVKFDDCKIELIKLFNCENRKELEIEEGILIKQYYDNILNKNIPCRTIKEWCNDNKEKLNKNRKEYYNDNKIHLLEVAKKYREENKEKIQNSKKEWYDDNKEKMQNYRKEYYNNNKEILKDKHKQWCNDNKEKLNVECLCGGKYIITNKSIHLKTKKHLEFINQN